MRAMTVSFALLAAPAVAQDADADAIAGMTLAIEEAGCVVTVENGDAVMAASGLGEDDVMQVIATLYENGLVALQADGTMKLTNEVCP